MDSRVGGRLSLAVTLNLAGALRSQIRSRPTTTVHCEDATCSGDIFLERSRNGNHGISKCYMEKCDGLNAQKRSKLKPLLTTLQSRVYVASYPREAHGRAPEH